MICTWTGKAIGGNRRLIPTKHGRWASSNEYKKFKENLIAHFKLHFEQIPGDVCVHLRFWIHPRSDSDNFIKPVFDALEGAGIVENDNLIKFYTVRVTRRKQKDPDKILVIVLRHDESYQAHPIPSSRPACTASC